MDIPPDLRFEDRAGCFFFDGVVVSEMEEAL